MPVKQIQEQGQSRHTMERARMNNATPSIKELSPEVVEHLPKLYQDFFKIEQEARRRVNAILSDIEDGKVTVEQVKADWGI